MLVITPALVPSNPLFILTVVPDTETTSTTSSGVLPKINKSPVLNQLPSSTTKAVADVSETVPSIKTSDPHAYVVPDITAAFLYSFPLLISFGSIPIDPTAAEDADSTVAAASLSYAT